MASTSESQKGRDVVLPTLDVFIQALNTAKDACGIPPAQIALGSASTLLTMIRVHSPLLSCEQGPLTYVHLGHHGQLSGLRRPRKKLRKCVSSAPPETEGKTIGRTHPGRPRCDWGSDRVSQTSDSGDERRTYRCIDRRSVGEMRRKVDRRGKRNVVFRSILAKRDKEEIAAWNQDLVRILHVFNVRSIGPVGKLQTESPFRPSWRLTRISGSRTPKRGSPIPKR
jgi:hypothetical protein